MGGALQQNWSHPLALQAAALLISLFMSFEGNLGKTKASFPQGPQVRQPSPQLPGTPFLGRPLRVLVGLIRAESLSRKHSGWGGGLKEGQGQCPETLQGEKRVACLPILYPSSWAKWGSMSGAKPWA